MTLEQIIALDKECFMNTFGDRVPVAFDHGCGATLTSLDAVSYTHLDVYKRQARDMADRSLRPAL